MAYELARQQLEEKGFAERIRVFDCSTATVALAAEACRVEPDRIAKSLAFRSPNGPFIAVVSGKSRIDNRKFKNQFHHKARFLDTQEAEAATHHPVGGVCPFGLPAGVRVWLDISLRRHKTVFPAVGSANSAVELSPEELEQITGAAGWIDITGDYDEQTEE